MAFFLYAEKRLHTFCTPFAHLPESGAFLRKACTACFPLHKKSLVGARPRHLAGARPFGHSKAPLGLLLLRKRESFMQTELSSILCVRLRPSAGWLQGSLCRRFLLPPAFHFAGALCSSCLSFSSHARSSAFRGLVIYRMRLDFLVLRGHRRVSHADGHAVFKVWCGIWQ